MLFLKVFFPVRRDNISVSFKLNTIIGWFQAPGTIKFWKASFWFQLYTKAMQKCFYGSNMFVPIKFPMYVLTTHTLEIKSLKCVCLECTIRRYWAFVSFELLEKLGGIKKDPKYSLLVIDTQLHFAQVENFIFYGIFQAVD